MQEMQHQTRSMKTLVENSEWIGVIGSPSTSNTFTVDLIEASHQKGLVGNFCIAGFHQDAKYSFAIGQIVSINLQNPYLERHSIQKIISVKGEAHPLTAYHDIRQVQLQIAATYSITNDSIVPVNMGSIPSTGTRIYALNSAVMQAFTQPFQHDTFFVGELYNTTIRLPTIYKHFGTSDDESGLGEAYHIGVFGKTGSGKSVLAKMLVAAYSRHHPMSILIIDPQGEFSKEVKTHGVLAHSFLKHGKTARVYDVSQISLRNLESFKKMLILSGFLLDIGVRAPDNQDYAATLITSYLSRPRTVSTVHGRIRISLNTAGSKDAFHGVMTHIQQNVGRIYGTRELQQRVIEYITTQREQLFAKWQLITALFSTQSGKISIDSIMQMACGERDIIILDLSEISADGIYWNDQVLAIILKDILSTLKLVGNAHFKRGSLLNLLVVIDEAHRFAPRSMPEDDEFQQLKREFIDGVRTTRKYGLGWLFISQTLASLDVEILNQLRLYFFGYGLSWGNELRVLRDIVGGGEHIALYQNFRDPQTSAILGDKQYPFMVFGPASPLSVSGSPLFFTSLDYFNEFLAANT